MSNGSQIVLSESALERVKAAAQAIMDTPDGEGINDMFNDAGKELADAVDVYQTICSLEGLKPPKSTRLAAIEMLLLMDQLEEHFYFGKFYER
jgi:hypothetical protein